MYKLHGGGGDGKGERILNITLKRRVHVFSGRTVDLLHRWKDQGQVGKNVVNKVRKTSNKNSLGKKEGVPWVLRGRVTGSHIKGISYEYVNLGRIFAGSQFEGWEFRGKGIQFIHTIFGININYNWIKGNCPKGGSTMKILANGNPITRKVRTGWEGREGEVRDQPKKRFSSSKEHPEEANARVGAKRSRREGGEFPADQDEQSPSSRLKACAFRALSPGVGKNTIRASPKKDSLLALHHR